MIAAGAVVTRNVPPFAVVKGNPGRITGFVDQDNEKKSPKADFDGGVIKGVKPVSLSLVNDLRGDLLVAELNDRIPFPVKRMFYVMNVPSHRLRGEHAHKECHQLLFCLQGSVWVSVDNGRERGTWLLERPDQGIHIAPMVWAAQYRYSQNAVLGVFASHAYDPSDYIRDYEEFLRLVKT
jgi:dTDP-4-dehydrorhamnose 3,5-epimerase-like enzyme